MYYSVENRGSPLTHMQLAGCSGSPWPFPAAGHVNVGKRVLGR